MVVSPCGGRLVACYGCGHRVILRESSSTSHSKRCGGTTMTAPHVIDPAGMLGQALSQASPDLMRSLLQHVINALLSADADAACGANKIPNVTPGAMGIDTGPWTPGSAPLTWRSANCVQVPTSRQWLLQRRKRSETALITVVAHCSWREHPRAVWTSSSKPWESQDCPSPRSHVWQQTSTNTSNSSATVPSMALVLSRSSPLTH